MLVTSLTPLNPSMTSIPLPIQLPPPTAKLPRRLLLRCNSFPSPPTSFPYSFPTPEPDVDDDRALGDCLVFDPAAFEDGAVPIKPPHTDKPPRRRPPPAAAVTPETLVPDKWKDIAEKLNITKKERQMIARQDKFRPRRQKLPPVPDKDVYTRHKEVKMGQLRPTVLEEPDWGVVEVEEMREPPVRGRAVARNPRVGLEGGTLEDVAEFFNSGEYAPGEGSDEKKMQGQKLFTQEEKALLNKRTPDLAAATSSKWMPIHTLAASGEFYLMDMLLKHNVDINAVDKDGFSAIHRAIIGKKQAIINYLLRNSVNPFILDKEGATLIHYAVQTASSQTIKILLLYDVDINLADEDGWTPLHLAVQTQRTDIVRLLLIKGADRFLKTRDGLTPLDLCLYSGHSMRTYELIKLLKELPNPKLHP